MTARMDDAARAQAVGSNAALSADATMASMAIRAALSRPDYILPARALGAVERMLKILDLLARYRDDGQLGDLLSTDKVAIAPLELVQVMARAAEQTEPANSEDVASLDAVIDSRTAVSLDANRIEVKDDKDAAFLAEALKHIGNGTLAVAIAQDRLRTSAYAVA
jgi:hypothetical protein